MPRTIVIDFETYWDTKAKYSLRSKVNGVQVGYPDFIHDKRFKVHGLGVYIEGEEPRMVWDKDVPAFLASVQEDILVMHNGYFDAAVMAWHYNFRPRYIIDTLSLANHVLGSARDTGGRNDLATLAERLGFETRKGDLSFSDGVRDLDDGEKAAMEVYVKRDLLLTREVLDTLLPQVTNPDFELWLADHTLRIYTDKPLPVDMALVEKTRTLIVDRLAERRAASGVAPSVLSSNKQFQEELTNRLTAAKLKMPMKVSPSTGQRIPALAKSDAGFMKLLESGDAPVVNLIRARLVERSATQAMNRLGKLEFYNSIGGLRTHLVYYGAHTGRWAAAGGFNVQNLTSPDRAVDPVDREIAASIRAAITPGDGLVFVPTDAAQIEARVIAWLAGESSILEAFASGADIYSQFISEVTGESIRKPTAGDSPAEAAKLKLWRNVGKEAVLGLGFGMGVDKFLFRLSDPKNPDIAKMVETGAINITLAGEIVKAYRSKYEAIVDFWYQLNRAFMWAKDGRIVKVGPYLKLKKVGRGAVGIVLPSGRTLYYRHIRREKYTGKQQFTDANGKSQNTRRGEWEWKHGSGQRIYGGLLAENVTQAVARDVLAETIHAAETEKGYEVVMTIHDEVVPRVPAAQGEECLAWTIKSLSTPPVWAPGLPLAAEGHVRHNLGK